MTRITIDAQTVALLESVGGEVEVCDAAGNVLGWYAPAKSSEKKPTLQELMDSCPTSEEELQRRLRKEKGQGRTWQEIRKDLEAM